MNKCYAYDYKSRPIHCTIHLLKKKISINKQAEKKTTIIIKKTFATKGHYKRVQALRKERKETERNIIGGIEIRNKLIKQYTGWNPSREKL